MKCLDDREKLNKRNFSEICQMLNSRKTREQMNQLRMRIAFEIQHLRNSGAKVNISQISLQLGCDIRIVRVMNRIDSA